MKTMNQFEKSLALLDKFLTESPAEDLNSMRQKIDELEIKGPTFYEYLVSMEESFRDFMWHQNYGTMLPISCIGAYKIRQAEPSWCNSPPRHETTSHHKKDSAYIAESFFLV